MDTAPQIDVDALIAPISEASPAGQPQDNDVLLLTQNATFKRGLTNEGAVDPRQWFEILDAASELLKRTKDLRVAVVHAQALAHTDGWAGFQLGLAVIKRLIDTHWDALYPLLVDGSPNLRVNALAGLASPDFLEELRDVALLGSMTLRALEAGGVSPALVDTYGRLAAELQQAPSATLQTLREIMGLLGEHKAHAETELEALCALAERAQRQMQALEALRAPQGSAAGAPADTAALGRPTETGFTMSPVRSRADVMYALDQICAYYDAVEPSSPVPLLLQRARRLVNMRFLDVIKDLADRSVEQIQLIVGRK